ncbi:MAG: hypothetical protein AB8F95_11800 [Bacteroidia bacterium]
MSIYFWAALLLVGAGIVYYYVRQRQLAEKATKLKEAANVAHRKHHRESMELLAPIYKPLENGEVPKAEDIDRMAHDPKTRFKLYQALQGYNQEHLFPSQHYSFQHLAESQIMQIAHHLTGANDAQDSVEFDGNVSFSREAHNYEYYVFRVKMLAPNERWLHAICGPYEPHHKAHTLALNIQFAEMKEGVSFQQQCERLHDAYYEEPEEGVKALLNLNA